MSNTYTKEVPHQVTSRPITAEGTFWRIITVNDVYELSNYTRIASAVKAAKEAATDLDCVVTSHLNGDFMSPSTYTSADGGLTLTKAMNYGKIDFASLGNHEFDVGKKRQAVALEEYNGVCLNSNCDDPQISHLPKYKILEIGSRKAVIGGYLTTDDSIYTASNLPNSRRINEACFTTWDDAKKEIGSTPDVFLPMTHQLLQEDVETCELLAGNNELKNRVPILLGGHEHEIYIQEAGKSMVVKMGMDAERIGVIDIWWTKDGEIKHQISNIDCMEFPVEAECAAWVRKQEESLQEKMNIPIAFVPYDCTSKTTRMEASGMAVWLCSKIKKSLKNEGVEVVFLNGGGVRGKRDYKAGEPFLLDNLYKELPFAYPIWPLPVPAQVLADSVKTMNLAPTPNPGYLHLDDGCKLDKDNNLIEVDGQPFDKNKEYIVATDLALFKGINNIEPLTSYCRENLKLPSNEAGLEAKGLFISQSMKETWRKLIGYKSFDTDSDGDISHEELVAGVEAFIAKVDNSDDGFINQQELREYMEKTSFEAVGMISNLISNIDENGDGKISKAEFLKLAF
eukprot:CAMPEP_0178957232 /NCGR_PEP_ID=MMETSP0789-20121207/10773_1 /TAXON_ID=3005 /ORGANISM="Rhizosolenia setigera, Strain CCMP 1694" /LENGTH=566 /DNA_ID=CAMNT_0020639405 /DNA_START=122 /DNA_END=1822 /DNA_ORIENTATION=-